MGKFGSVAFSQFADCLHPVTVIESCRTFLCYMHRRQGRSWPGGRVQGSGPPPEVARTTFVNHANSMTKFSRTPPPTPTAAHEIWPVDSQENL